jgi:hypothetical protein
MAARRARDHKVENVCEAEVLVHHDVSRHTVHHDREGAQGRVETQRCGAAQRACDGCRHSLPPVVNRESDCADVAAYHAAGPSSLKGSHDRHDTHVS